MELLVVMSIISLLASVVMSTLKVARNKARFAQVVTEMVSIAKAGNMDYSENGSYSPEVAAGVAPSFVPGLLGVWPTAPCAGWKYDWENSPAPYVGVVLRDAASAAIYSLCLDESVCTGAINDVRADTSRSFECH